MGIIQPPMSMDLFEPVKTPLILPDGTNPKGYLITPEYLIDNVSRNQPPWQTLVERCVAKNHQRILVPELETEIVTPQMLANINLAYLGTGGGETIYARNKGKPDCKYMPPRTGGITNNELSREFLKWCLEQADGRVIRCPRSDNIYFEIPPTLYYEGGRHQGSFAYVDISQAYWTIAKTSSIDMRYRHESFALTGNAPFREVPEITAYRQLRHAIPGNLRCGKIQMARHGKFSMAEFRGNLSYPSMIGYIMHVMHAIAREVLDHFGAFMILTDAFVIPLKYAELLVEFLWERWYLHSVIKASGSGTLYELGVYQIGTKRSIDAPVRHTDAASWMYTGEDGVVREHQCQDQPFSNLVNLNPSWMQNRRSTIIKQGLGRV